MFCDVLAQRGAWAAVDQRLVPGRLCKNVVKSVDVSGCAGHVKGEELITWRKFRPITTRSTGCLTSHRQRRRIWMAI